MEDKNINEYQLQLAHLPKDILRLIASFLDNKTLSNLRLANSYFELISRSAFLHKAAENRIIQIASGGSCSYIIKANGMLYALGYNSNGQLGLGHNNHCHTPQLVDTLSDVVTTNGEFHTLAITKDGTLHAWGYNDDGQLGLGHNNGCNTPQVVDTSKDFVSISARGFYTLALAKGGLLYAWGNNYSGQLGLGLGHNNPCNTPQVVTALKNVLNMTTGYQHSLAITQDGKLYAWGDNVYGQLGLGHNNECNTPQVVTASNNVVSIAAGDEYTFAITKNGILYAWGNNVYGQLGLGHTKQCNKPQVVTTLKDVVSVTAGEHHTLAITKNGTLYAWGSNQYGQLGLGHNNEYNLPQVVTTLKDVVSITAGRFHSLAITKNGTLYAWGNNDFGQLGLGFDIEMINTPKPIPQLNNVLKIVNSITNRECKRRKLTNVLISPKTKQALLDELNDFLSPYLVDNSSPTNTTFTFFAPKSKIKWAQDLKDFITGINTSIESIENEIKSYKTLNFQEDPDNYLMEHCLDEMTQILEEAKKPLVESIETELYSMIKRS